MALRYLAEAKNPVNQLDAFDDPMHNVASSQFGIVPNITTDVHAEAAPSHRGPGALPAPNPPSPPRGTPAELRKRWLKDRPTANAEQATHTSAPALVPPSPSAPAIGAMDLEGDEEILWDAERLDNLNTSVDALRLRADAHENIIQDMNNKMSLLLGQDAPHQGRLKALRHSMSQHSSPERPADVATTDAHEHHEIGTPKGIPDLQRPDHT